jgi:hypothetical protein
MQLMELFIQVSIVCLFGFFYPLGKEFLLGLSVINQFFQIHPTKLTETDAEF